MKEMGAKYEDISFSMPVEAKIDGTKFLYKQSYEGVPVEINDPYVISYDDKLFQIYKPSAQYLYFTSKKPDHNFTELSGLELIYSPFEFVISALKQVDVDTFIVNPYNYNYLKNIFSLKDITIKNITDHDVVFETCSFHDNEYGDLSYIVTIAKDNYLPRSWKMFNKKSVVIKEYKVNKWGFISDNKLSYPEISEESLYSNSGELLRHCTVNITNVEVSNKEFSFTLDPRLATKINDSDRNLYINTKTGKIIDGDTLK